MIHGDLKGVCFFYYWNEFTLLTSSFIKVNVLIDETGHARIADFGLLTIISDPNILITSSSYMQGGTVRWMSPELIDPEEFGFKSARHTKSSDCYALGMVVYEAITGMLPFYEQSNNTVHVKVMRGKHPTRGAGFPEHVWRKLESCWAFHPDDRPNI
jgi:serine/threonine protein kinase